MKQRVIFIVMVCLSSFLISCATQPEPRTVTVTEQVPTLPDPGWLAPLNIRPPDKPMTGEALGQYILNELYQKLGQCNGDKEALRKWYRNIEQTYRD